MNLLFAPAIRLMQRLRLLPKFLLITFVFMAPLLPVTTLLINELERSITFAQQERTGVQLIREVEGLIHLAQQSRGLQYMALSGRTEVSLVRAVSVFRLTESGPAPDAVRMRTPALRNGATSVQASLRSRAVAVSSARTKHQLAIANGRSQQWEEC